MVVWGVVLKMNIKIFCFVNSMSGDVDNPFGNDVTVVALAEDGNVIAQHVSSSEYWARNDIGYEYWKTGIKTAEIGHGLRRMDEYKELYPDGFEMEWVNDPLKHEGVMKAYKINQDISKWENALDKISSIS